MPASHPTTRDKAWPLATIIGLALATVATQGAALEPTAAGADPAVTTRHYRITFSRQDGAPVRWEHRAQGRGQVELIDTDLLSTPGPRPLELHLPGLSLTKAAVTVTHTPEADAEVLVTRWELAGAVVRRTLRVPRDGHTSELDLEITNRSDTPLALADSGRGPGLTWGPGLGTSPARSAVRSEEMGSYVEPFFFEAESLRSQQVEGESAPFALAAPIAWAGLHRHYHALALWPADGQGWTALSAGVDPRLPGSVAASGETRFYPTVSLYTAPATLAPGASRRWSFKLYVGPKDRAALQRVLPGLGQLTYQHLWGWMAALCLALEWLLSVVNALVGNWGASIVLLAVALRAVIWPLSRYGERHQKAAQARQAEFNRRSAELKAQYKDQPDLKDEKILALYKEIGISPTGQLKGCLPMMLQIPILIGLYHVLSSTWTLRGVPFLWIDDLTLSDRVWSWGPALPWLGAHLNLLPLVMFAAQVYIALAMEPPTSSGKARPNRSVLLTPFIMLVLFYPFPAGCMLYWTVANLSQAVEMFVGRRVRGRRSGA